MGGIVCPACRLEGHEIAQHERVGSFEDVRTLRFRRKGDEFVLANVGRSTVTSGMFGGQKVKVKNEGVKKVIHKVLDMGHGGQMRNVEDVVPEDGEIRLQPSANIEIVKDKENNVLVVEPPKKTGTLFESRPLQAGPEKKPEEVKE
jgi:hypothetical protein